MERAMKVISFISAKGGAGKTVTAAAVGTFLSQIGFKVLLVDADASTNGMTLLYLQFLLRSPPRESPDNKGLFEVGPEGEIGVITITNQLHLAPATYELKDTNRSIPSNIHAAIKTLSATQEPYDFIIFDAEAGAEEYAYTACLNSDVVIVVSEYDPVSAQGVERLRLLFAEALRPESTWVLFNKVLPEFARSISTGLSIANYLPPITWDADVIRALARRDLAIDMESPNAHTLSIAQLVVTLFPGKVAEKVEAWLGQARQRLSSPLVEEIAQKERALSVLYATRARRRRVTLAAAAVISAVMTSLIATATVLAVPDRTIDLDPQFVLAFVTTIAAAAAAATAFSANGLSSEFLRNMLGLSVVEPARDDEFVLSREITNLTQKLTSLESALSVTYRTGLYEKVRRGSAEVLDS
jgi:cellulose biosynthesis protein BcsQ